MDIGDARRIPSNERNSETRDRFRHKQRDGVARVLREEDRRVTQARRHTGEASMTDYRLSLRVDESGFKLFE